MTNRLLLTKNMHKAARVLLLLAFPFALAGFGSTAVAAESMHASIEKYEGSKTCLECHDTLGKEVAESIHYKGRGPAPNLIGDEPGKQYGFLSGSCIPGITNAGNNWLALVPAKDAGKEGIAAGCALCHAGAGVMPAEKIEAAEYDNIDCLICHGPDYKRTVVKDSAKGNPDRYKIVPAPGVDALKSARKAQKTTAEMCLRCHTSVGGGPNFKHGTIPTVDTDVHLSMGMNCTECHTVKKHRIAGGSDLLVQDAPEIKVKCANCHTATPHKGRTDEEKEAAVALNRHAERFACPTCHVPAAARDSFMPTMIAQDWSQPKKDPLSGFFLPTTKLAEKVQPEYFWWNGTVRPDGMPVGARTAPGSLISPWKKVTYTLIVDEKSGKPINLNLATYWATGDVSAAARKGAADAGQPYIGTWKTKVENHYYSLNHQVAPKNEAYRCANCHAVKSFMDFKALKRQRL